MDKSERKQRVVVKTPFQVSILQQNGSLRVVSSGHSDYKSAENWVKSDARDELKLDGYINFYIFHAKKMIGINFDSSGATEDLDDVVTDDPGSPDRSTVNDDIVKTEDVYEYSSDEDDSVIVTHDVTEEETKSPLQEMLSDEDDDDNDGDMF